MTRLLLRTVMSPSVVVPMAEPSPPGEIAPSAKGEDTVSGHVPEKLAHDSAIEAAKNAPNDNDSAN
ncbi:hypothetical protein GCM10023223_50470 [Stackebrandtia albiflava]